MPNYGYRDKYQSTISQMFQDGRKEVIEYICDYLKESLVDYQDMNLGQVLDKEEYSFIDTNRDSIYCTPYHECIVIMEYLTNYNDSIDTELMNPNNDPNNPYEPMEGYDITTHITEVMRNWILNGLDSLFNQFTDREKTVKENLDALVKEHKDVLGDRYN